MDTYILRDRTGFERPCKVRDQGVAVDFAALYGVMLILRSQEDNQAWDYAYGKVFQGTVVADYCARRYNVVGRG